MAKQAKPGKKKTNDKESPAEGLWIARRNSIKSPTGKSAWENLPGSSPSSNRFLELADVALGLKKR